jgi:hypothetical protein
VNGRRLPRTSYGYLPPADVRVQGWRCPSDDCSGEGEWEPRVWPFPCPRCRRPADPVFADPWSHDAEGYRLRHWAQTAADAYSRDMARAMVHAWEYLDAQLRGDRGAATAARLAWRQATIPTDEGDQSHRYWLTLGRVVLWATRFGDLDAAADEILLAYRLVDTTDLGSDVSARTGARTFLSTCVTFLNCRESIGQEREFDVWDAMEDVAERAHDYLTSSYLDGAKQVRHLRARAIEVSRISEEDHSQILTVGPATELSRAARVAAVRGAPFRGLGLSLRRRIRTAGNMIANAKRGDSPEALLDALDDLTALLRDHGQDEATFLRVSAALVDGALFLAEMHDDTTALETLARVFGDEGAVRGRDVPDRSMARLLTAHVHLRSGRMNAAVDELRQSAASHDRLTRLLLPELHAVLGQLLALQRPEALSEAIDECMSGRRHGLHSWRGTTGADLPLARLLLRRALQTGGHASSVPDTTEALRLSRRHSRPWRADRSRARLILNEGLRIRDALTGDDRSPRRARSWRRAADVAVSSSMTDRAELAAAWVRWAIDTDEPRWAAEAYHHLMSLLPRDVSGRYHSTAKDRVLAAVQEHTEEAGYWLARAGRYRDAVVALETGRAVLLSENAGRDSLEVGRLLHETGHEQLHDDYRRALMVLDEQERRAPTEPESSDTLRFAWMDVRSQAREIARITGVNPLDVTVDYGDIAAATGDGALVYIAAAKASGYALVVIPGHDPQLVQLPGLTRETVEVLVDSLLPHHNLRVCPSRLAEALKTLWNNGLEDLFLMHARGAIVTLVPVGLLGLLPLHAAGDPGAPGDRFTEWRHAGSFSAVRYAPNARMLRRCAERAARLPQASLSLLAVHAARLAGTDPLPEAPTEIKETVRLWTGAAGPAREEPECTWDRFSCMADDYTVWHLACHGEALPGAIERSTLRFADRQVTLTEIRNAFETGLRRLAILSACRSQLTGRAIPNEMVGLATALLRLGFAGVIATSWKVNDQACSYLMARFYRLWCREGHDPPVALSLAQQWLRHATPADLSETLPNVTLTPEQRRCPHPFADPQFWAAFAYTGA